MKLSEKRGNMLHGVLLIALFSCAAFYISDFPVIKSLSFSPLIIGIVLGMAYANSLRNRLPSTWVPGILFCSKQLLRLGIILYGFNLTFQDIVKVGLPAILIDGVIVAGTIYGGVWIGRLLKMDRGVALLTSVGSGICGAAAILGAEATLRTKPYKTAVAVSTVVIFGTLSMFLYPLFYRNGLNQLLTPEQMGIYTGSTLHEVAHVVGAGNAMGREVSDVGIIVKMIRVILLVPALLMISASVARAKARKARLRGGNSIQTETGKVTVPWFALGFLAVIAFHSLGWLPEPVIGFIKRLDTFLLTMAMTALGAETSIEKFKKAGAKPFLLASILYVWLLGGGFLLVKYVTPWLM